MENPRVVAKPAKVDIQELLVRVDNDRELMKDLFAIFIGEFPRHLKSLREMIAQGNCSQARLVSHTLKGMLANLAIAEASAAAAALEDLARKERKDALPEALANFDRSVVGLLDEVRSYAAGK